MSLLCDFWGFAIVLGLVAGQVVLAAISDMLAMKKPAATAGRSGARSALAVADGR